MATYLRTVDKNPWIPEHSKPRRNARQRQFLLLTDVNEVFYGGAAGGGKTYANLIAAAQYVDVPGYSALLLRENFADLNQPMAWVSLSKAWWKNAASWNASEHRWTFPSGATITFGYLERDDSVYQYDSAAYQFIGIDELTQHTEWRYTFLFGRIRRPAEGPLAGVPLRMRTASNPGNKGHEWVKKRFIDAATRQPGAVFVPARLDDNAGNMDVEAYRRDSLSKLDPITRAQREAGDWDAVAGGRFQRDWFRRYRWRGDYLCLDGADRQYLLSECRRFGTADVAASIKTSADYTVISSWAITPLNELVWLDCHRGKWEVPDIVPQMQEVYDRWNLACLAVEGGGTQQGVYQLARRTRMVVKEVTPEGKDKLERATRAIVLFESGRVYLPAAAAWLADAEAELVRFTGDPKQDAHDDVVDTVSYAAKLLGAKDDAKARGFTPYIQRS